MLSLLHASLSAALPLLSSPGIAIALVKSKRMSFSDSPPPIHASSSCSEWRWDDEAGVPYFEYLFVKNPDIDQIKELIEEQIFNVDEITEVNDVSIEIDNLKRSAVIRYEAVTDEKTYKEEVKIGG